MALLMMINLKLQTCWQVLRFETKTVSHLQLNQFCPDVLQLFSIR